MSDENLSSSLLNDALDIYEKSSLLKNELARSNYKLGCVLQDSGDLEEGTKRIKNAEELRKEILKDEWKQAQGEEDFDRLVMFWSR
jgi:hypothetical protein